MDDPLASENILILVRAAVIAAQDFIRQKPDARILAEIEEAARQSYLDFIGDKLFDEMEFRDWRVTFAWACNNMLASM